MTLTWLITGANRGIGLEFARQLTAAGDRVVAIVRDPGSATQLNTLASAQAGLDIEQADMDDRASIEALAERLNGTPIDILFNNAGLYGGSWDNASHRQSAGSMDYMLWEQIMRVNVMAPFQMIQALLPNLLLGQRKLVVNMSSDLGSIANNLQGQSYAYRSSKAALNMVTKGLSVELAGDGVTVVAMAPGWTQTDLGGTQAHWSVEDSVANQRKVIAGLTASDSGRFVNLLGQDVPW
jgi:NAD(P)-dependent dehydrogenase (short-subunit alcohol dehydrogenase family)